MLKKNQILNQKVKIKKSNDPTASAGLSRITVSPFTKGAEILGLRLLSPSLPPEGKDRNILRNVE